MFDLDVGLVLGVRLGQRFNATQQVTAGSPTEGNEGNDHEAPKEHHLADRDVIPASGSQECQRARTVRSSAQQAII